MLPGIFAAIHCKRFSRGSSPLCTANMCVEKSTANATFFSFSFQLAAERWRFAQFSRRRRLDRIGSDPNGTEQYGTDISFFAAIAQRSWRGDIQRMARRAVGVYASVLRLVLQCKNKIAPICVRETAFEILKKKIKKTSQVIAVQSYAKRLAKRLNA